MTVSTIDKIPSFFSDFGSNHVYLVLQLLQAIHAENQDARTSSSEGKEERKVCFYSVRWCLLNLVEEVMVLCAELWIDGSGFKPRRLCLCVVFLG